MTQPSAFDLLATRLDGKKPVRVAPYVELGTPGLSQTGGQITEEFLQALRGNPGMKMYREMRDNSPIVGATFFAIEMLARETGWQVEQNDADEQAVELIQTSLEDMSRSWDDTLTEILSCLTYGFSVHEIVYKRRQGAKSGPGASSQYSDGLIGWRKWAPRSQLTVWAWNLDDRGSIQGLEQYDPYFPSSVRGRVYMPIDKLLLFRPFAYLNNPQGRSLLRNAFTSYHYSKRIAEIEAIGIERDLAGLPVVKIPGEIIKSGGSDYEQWKNLAANVKRNEQAGVVMPSDRYGMDGQGELMYELTLLSTGGERQIQTNEVLQRYETRMAQTVLAEFIQLGSTPNGTRSLAETKSSMFATALGALLDSIASVINRHAIPRLLKLNGMDTENMPEFRFDDIEYTDVNLWAEALSKMAAAGMPLFPDPAIEAVVRQKLDLPELTEEQIEQREERMEAEEDRAERAAEAQTIVAENEAAGEPEEPEDEEEEPPVAKMEADEFVAKVVAALPDYTPQFDQLSLAIGDRFDKVEAKAAETSVAVQGAGWQLEALGKRVEGMDGDERIAATASAAAAKMAGIEPLTKEAWTDVVTEALSRQPVPETLSKADMAEAVQVAIAPLAEAITLANRPKVKRARKLEDGSVEITES